MAKKIVPQELCMFCKQSPCVCRAGQVDWSQTTEPSDDPNPDKPDKAD